MKYKVGDIVRVRDWSDMENDPKVSKDHDGDLHNKDSGILYVTSMKEYCCNTYKITKKERDFYRLEGVPSCWDFADWMLEEVKEQEEIKMEEKHNISYIKRSADNAIFKLELSEDQERLIDFLEIHGLIYGDTYTEVFADTFK